MPLIKSVSGIRGTIGGTRDSALTPDNVVRFVTAFVTYAQRVDKGSGQTSIVVGKDARTSGDLIKLLVNATVVATGAHVIDLDLATTPTVEMAVQHFSASGGIVITASHNPANWNALKLLNSEGEFLSQQAGMEVLTIADQNEFNYAEVNSLGRVERRSFMDEHIEAVCNLPAVQGAVIRQREYRVVVDAVNSVGGIAVPKLLTKLGVEDIVELHCDPTGMFAHNPEPLPAHLEELSKAVVNNQAHLGIAVDPDVDRVAFVCEDGSFFGEEYGLVAIADYVLSSTKGNTVSNLSSTRALRQVTEARDGNYFASAVGEVHVVEKMKEVQAVIGGEGNGGIIYPELHYGRDALVGVALFLSHLATSGGAVKELRDRYPHDVIMKSRIQLDEISAEDALRRLRAAFDGQPLDETDGLRIEFDEDWVHIRKSNTEPILRIYAESASQESAEALSEKVISVIRA